MSLAQIYELNISIHTEIRNTFPFLLIVYEQRLMNEWMCNNTPAQKHISILGCETRIDDKLNECLMTPQHKKYLGY